MSLIIGSHCYTVRCSVMKFTAVKCPP